MCNHVYKADYTARPEGMGSTCPYPAFYATLPSDCDPTGGTERAVLPLDVRGACIFHSQDVAWKRENDFPASFQQLLRLLDAVAGNRYDDFTEFVFVGSAVDGSLRLKDTVFLRQAYFTGARFADPIVFEGVEFPNAADFDQAVFDGGLTVRSSLFNGLGMIDARVGKASFIQTEFRGYALFTRSRFSGTSSGASGYAVRFEDCRFGGLTDFSKAHFELRDDSTAGFTRVTFEGFADFRDARFACHSVFRDITFMDVADFIDTRFELVASSARYIGAAAEFINIVVPAGGVLSFVGSTPQARLFEHDVELRFREDALAGAVRFENVNLTRLIPSSRERLTALEKAGRVEIGAGCIKYRLQTEVRTLPVGAGNAALATELCQTFASYFTASNGLNLGFEVVSRDREAIRFFYFTDEDISYEPFLERLAQCERNLWNLLLAGSQEELLALAGAAPTAGAERGPGESAVINAVDGLSALLGTFFRVGARIATGRWKEADTRALLGAIRFNEAGAELRAAVLHRTLVGKYSDASLIGLSQRQNGRLFPIYGAGSTITPGRVRILFLGANSVASPLDLEREVSRIQTSLRLASERDNLELTQVWAVTVDSLMQAMLDAPPAIVHFSGHGERDGIVLRDEAGAPRLVPQDALESLFALFSGTVQCVVLNACYSEAQARSIRRHVPFVVGMTSSIPDAAAIAFSTGFYKALGAGREVPFAFETGRTRVRMEGAGGEEMLVLL